MAVQEFDPYEEVLIERLGLRVDGRFQKAQSGAGGGLQSSTGGFGIGGVRIV